MQYIKTPAEKRINLQSGMYCHVLDNELVINDVTTVEPRHLDIKLDKINSNNTIQYALNIILTLGLIIFILYTSFFLFLPLFFVSLWHLRKIKQQTIPQNKSNCIPYNNIQKIELEKGKLGFNYLKIYINNNNIQSLKILRLYDSESTFEQAKKILSKWIIPEETNNNKPLKIAGFAIPVSKTENYLFNNEYAYYTQNNVYELNKQDRYTYIRSIAIFVGLILIASIIAKINLMINGNPNYIDFIVLLFFAFLFLIPIKYSSKAVPNQFKINSIQKIKTNSKKIILTINDSSWFLPLKIHFKIKHLSKDQSDFLKNIQNIPVKN
jgi:hypothetical protein